MPVIHEALSPWECFSHRVPGRTQKLRGMRPKRYAGNIVGTKRSGNRTGGKRRGMKSGRQRTSRVNISKLTQKTNANANAKK